MEPDVLAQEMLHAYSTGSTIQIPPSSRGAHFDMNAAYAVEAAFTRLRIESGRQKVGVKVGYANKAVLRALKLETLVWAHMYDDTVVYVNGNSVEISLPYYRSPKIEPEIVFKLKAPIVVQGLSAAEVLASVEWLAIGFEIIDCPYPEWQFKPVDFVAAFGLHLRLVIGQPLHLDSETIPALVDALANFKVRVSKNGEFVEEGAGKNSLRSPALCLAEVAGAMLRQSGAEPLTAGDLISSGTLTAGHPVVQGDRWRVDVEGLPLSAPTVRFR